MKSMAQTVGPGSPPRVRSRRHVRRGTADNPGITSACAEQTITQGGSSPANGDHLRVCGADVQQIPPVFEHLGSPPRVRSRPHHPDVAVGAVGITSACAEQTYGCSPHAKPSKDHLRVCGADGMTSAFLPPQPGSPPRVRSRLQREHGHQMVAGITSACAEQTSLECSRSWSDWDHLRVCGADSASISSASTRSGSPPRVRSRPGGLGSVRIAVGITSACAEQTIVAEEREKPKRDHLRVCGADALSSALMEPFTWITSACAEQTCFRPTRG